MAIRTYDWVSSVSYSCTEPAGGGADFTIVCVSGRHSVNGFNDIHRLVNDIHGLLLAHK